MDNNKEIHATVQPRIYSAQKVSLEEKIPLETPFSAHIDICSICNFRCSFCFQADTTSMQEVGLKRGKMPMELFMKIVDGLKEFDEKLKKVKIGNHGEPTLHEDLAEMIAYIKQSNTAEVIEIFTNGSKLNPDLNIAMIEAGMDRINISLEGLTGERYQQVAGVKIDMDEMIRNITHLYSVRKNCKIYIKIADRTSPLDRTHNEIFILSSEEREYFYETFGNICDEIYIENIVPQWAETQLKKQNQVESKGMYGQKIKHYKDICPFTFMYLHFNWDGTTSPCTLDWPKKVVIGDAYQETPKEIWNGEKLRSLRIAMAQGKRNGINFCNHCSAPMVCVDEDLDPYKEKVLQVLHVTQKDAPQNNPWIGQ